MKIAETVLIIAEHLLEEAYPGGVRGLLRDQRRTHKSQKLTCTDGVVAVADDNAESLIATYDRLCALFKSTAINTTPCVFVNPVDGVLEACDWLVYAPDEDGSAIVRINERIVPAKAPKKTAARAARPKTASSSPAPIVPTLIKVSADEHFITWLDLETGRELISDIPAPARAVGDDTDAPVPMLDAVRALITRRGWDESTHDEEDGIIRLRLDAGLLLAVTVVFAPSERSNVLRIAVRLQGRTPKDRLDAVTNFIAGANWGLEVGNFDIDHTDGEVLYRSAVIAPDGEMRPSALEIAFNRSMGTTTHYAAGLMEVAQGADPREVLARIDAA